MAIVLDVASGDSDASVSSITDSVVVASGSNRRMIVAVANNDSIDGNPQAPASVTYNSIGLTMKVEQADSSPDESHVSIWELIAPDTGTHNLVVTSTGTFDFVDVGWVVLQGASQLVTPHDTAAQEVVDDADPVISTTATYDGVWAVSVGYPADNPATGSITGATEFEGGFFPDMGYSGSHSIGTVSHTYHGSLSTEDWLQAMILVAPVEADTAAGIRSMRQLIGHGQGTRD
jgi:hypothetical protein